MINPLEKTKLAEAEQARPKTEREQNPEVSEVDEAGLDKPAEEVDAEIEAKQADVFASADKRIESAPTSVGVSPEKAKEIYESGGFAERIKSIKEKIAALAESAKEKTDLIRLKLQGVKNPERVLATARYLEKTAVEKDSHSISVDKTKVGKIEKEAAKFRKQGYEVNVDEHYSDKTKMGVFARKENSYSFSVGKSKHLSRDIDKMVGSENDPVKMFEALRDVGYKIGITKGYTLSDDYLLKKLSKNPDVLPLLEKLKTFGGSSVVHDFGKSGDNALQRLSDLATKDAAEHIFTPEAEKGIEKISALLGKPIDFNMLESWTRLSKDPVLLEIMTVLKPTITSKNSYDEVQILYKLEAFKKAGVENEVFALLKDGFSERSLGKFNGWGESKREQAAKNLRVASEVFKTSPDLQRLVRDMDKIFGAKDDEEEILSQKNMERFQKLCESIPAASLAFANLADMGLRSDRWHGDLERLLGDNPENALAYKKVLEAIAEPDFKTFIAACEKTGYHFTLGDFFNSYPDNNRLTYFFKYKDGKSLFLSAVASESGSALAKHLGIFEVPMNEWNVWALQSLSQIPDSLSILKKLEENFAYKYDTNKDNNSGQLNALVQTMRNPELLNKLFEPKTIETIRRANGEFGVEFHLHEAERVLKIIEDPNLITAFQNPETVAFIKTGMNERNKNFETLVALSKCDPTLRPFIGKMIKEFKYEPQGTYTTRYESDEEKDDNVAKMELVLSDSEKFQELRDNPKILEAQQHLEAIGMHKNPLNNMETFKTVSENNLFSIFEQCKNSPKIQEFLWNNLNTALTMSRLSPEKVSTYLEIFQKIDDSPSQEIQRLKDSLLSQLMESEHPTEDYRKIESIFIKNNIPIVGKVYGVFETLHDPKILENKINSVSVVSPVLKEASTRKRYYTIYQDLLKIHIESGNRSLKEYAEVLQGGGQLIEQYEKDGLKSLNPRQQEQLRYFVSKLETLQARSALDTADDAFKVADVADLGQRISHVKEGLKVAEGQTVLERVSDMYLRPAGLKNFDELLERMRASKNGADVRSRQMIYEVRQKAGGSEIAMELKGGDFLKGVDAKYISNILQNGSVAKEFLGASSASDSTPMDTDISLVTSEDAAGGFTNSINTSLAGGYGEILFALRDRGQYQLTTAGQPARAEGGKMELFKTGALGERHYGIRTGFATTEIDFMIAKETLTTSLKDLEKLFFEVAQNGYYIPVTNTSGKVIFTPEMFDEYRKSFAGLEKFDAPVLDYHPTTPNEHSYKRVAEITATIPKDSERVDQVAQTIRSEIEQALSGLGVSLRPEFDTSILGAELLDTGSTGRHTNTPGDFDFDFSLKLDAKDFPKSAELAQAIKGMMTFTEDISHQEAGGYYQLRVKGVTSIGGKQLEKPIDIDIGFANKSDLSVYGSHDAIRDKLESIKNHNGQQAYEQTIANVILTKQTLKEGRAYKKLEDGGFGGVGVENWILANGGNMEEAFMSFRDAAYENGQRLSYEKFKEKYKILDPGTNIKFQGHDNFVEVLKPNGYEAMLNAIENYLNKQAT
ncbi:MAG: hypothetical protein EXS47_02770 [Candidatus Zambryskibacteria bacterium]|nr:hypothetical protein [Candidatus Zambryskibacteria bacterium]